MIASEEQLPDDVEALKKLLLAERAVTQQTQQKLLAYRKENAALHDQLRLARAKLFGKSSEKFEDILQARLFDEIESEAAKGPDLFADDIDCIHINEHSRKKRGRKQLPPYLPRVDIVHDISDAEKQCDCGVELKRIGEEVAEKLEIIPADIFVERHIRPKYACPACRGEDSEDQPVKIAPVPPQILEKSIAGPGLLAYLVTSKFCDALPLYRQEGIMRRLDIDLSRQTMSGWLMQLQSQLEPLCGLLLQELNDYPLIAIDETTLQVMREPDRKNTSKSYMWLLRGGPPDNPRIIYLYRKTRSADFLATILQDYTGAVLTDGYAGYDKIFSGMPGITHAACWDHARRKFVDLIKSAPNSPGGNHVLGLMRKLYRIEKKVRADDLTSEETLALRKEKSRPVLDELHTFLIEASKATPPRSLYGQAISYAMSQWSKLNKFLTDGRIPFSNILVENDIRPFVIGRKNWLFSGSPQGAHASAIFYTLAANAKASGIEPFSYFRTLFSELPNAGDDEKKRRLLPQYIDRSKIKTLQRN